MAQRTPAEEKRLVQLKGLLMARTVNGVVPKPGLKANVARLREEIAKLEAKGVIPLDPRSA